MNWHLETLQLKDLKEHPHNPRVLSKHEYQQLKTSMDRFGLIDKPIVNTDGQIIGGHQRINVLLLDGETQCECWVPDKQLTDSEVKELCIRLNRNGGDWDWDILADRWELDELKEWGFDDKELGIDKDLDLESLSEERAEKEKCPTCGKALTTTHRQTQEDQESP